MAEPQSTDSQDQVQQPFISHLLELRDRILRTVLAILVIFIGLFPFGNDIYHFIAGPLMEQLPEGTSMIATQVASPFLTPFKLSLVSAVFIAMPVILYQAWSFIAPGLYQHEKRLVIPLLVSSILLFYLGMAFAYFVVFPLVFGFLTSVAPDDVAVMTDITSYLDFVLALFFAFGIAFEVPIATIILVWMGITTPEKLASKRPYIIVGAFVIGMFLTPPDVISQTLLALPMWLLFEAGVIFSKAFVRKDDEEEEDDGEAVEASSGNPGSNEEHEKQDDEDAFVPLSEDEMEAELDRIEAEEEEGGDDEEGDYKEEEPLYVDPDLEDYEGFDEENEILPSKAEQVEQKLKEVNRLRDEMEVEKARTLLYEVLVDGDDDQVKTARNILAQLDES